MENFIEINSEFIYVKGELFFLKIFMEIMRQFTLLSFGTETDI